MFAYRGRPLFWTDEALLHCEGTYTRDEVPAVSGQVNGLLADGDLDEGKVNVHVLSA